MQRFAFIRDRILNAMRLYHRES